MKNESSNDFLSTVPKDTVNFNIKEFLMKYYHYLWLFILILGLSFLGAWLYLRYTIPKYSVSATLLIKDAGNKGGGADNSIFSDMMLFREGTNKQNEIQILKSRKLMTRVVHTLGLEYSYYVVGNVKTINIYKDAPFELQFIPPFDSEKSMRLEILLTGPNTFHIGKQQQEYNFGQVISMNSRKFRLIKRESAYSESEYKQFIVTWRTDVNASLSLLNNLEIGGADDMSNVLRLTFVTEDPELGADIINTLMNEYSVAGVEDKNQINRKILSFLDDRLNFVENQLDSVERDMQQYKTTREVIDLGTQSQVYFGNMTETEKQVREQEVQLQVVNLIEDYLKDSTHNLMLVPSTLGIADQTLQALTNSYNELLNEREKELQTGATVNSSVVRSLDKNINDARNKLLRSLINIKAMYQGSLNSLRSQNTEFKNQLASIPQKERENRERSRQQEIKQNLYLYLLQKKEESGIAQASTLPSSRVIDEALTTANMVSPDSLRIQLIALVAGLIFPIGIIYIRDLLNDKITTRADIVKVTNIPIIAEIGHSREMKPLLFLHKSRSIIAEQVRILRSNLAFLLLDKPDKYTILVTSSFSGEGKSFVSINLSAALALSGKKTVLLEFDLRKPKVAAGLELPKSQGLTNYLVGSTSLEQLPQAVPGIENLFVIACGPIPPNPSEILLSEKMPILFAWLREKFDVVVIDTAPIGLVSDSLTLSQYADASLYLIRQRYTFKKQLHYIQELYAQQKLPKMGLIINDVISSGVRNYYGYSSGRYGYGYGYGYGGKDGYYESENNGLWSRWKRRVSRKRKTSEG